MNFEFMTIDTPLPPCMPFPRALTGFPVSSTARDIAGQIREVYGNQIHIFANCISLSVRAAETTAEGKSIFLHDPVLWRKDTVI